jgi:hypothetical protein
MLAADSKLSAANQAGLIAQILEHFDASELPLDTVADSNVPVTTTDDQYPAWHPDTYLFEAIVKALFVAQLRGFSFARLHRALVSQSGRAAALGFDPDRIPHRSVLC